MADSRRSSTLKFKRHTNDQRQQSSADWEGEVEQTLLEADPDRLFFSDPRFDPLKQALRILSSVTAERDLNDLREKWLAVDALVDSAVDAHYAGFNKSLQNYSQILRLFSDARVQLGALRRCLEQAQVQLMPQPGPMRELYRRDLMLQDVGRLLQDVQVAVEVPAKVQALEQRGEWSLAVSTLLDGSDKVAREELASVAALRQLREELSQRRESLLTSLSAEIERLAFNPATTQWGANNGGFSTPTRPGATPGTLLVPRSRRPTVSYDSRDLATPPRRPVHRRTATFGAGMGAGGVAKTPARAGQGHLMDAELAMSTLVSCVAQLGGVQAVIKALRAHMPTQMRSAISEALASFPRSQWLRSDGRGSTALVTPSATGAAAAAVAAAAMEFVCSRCLATLQSIARLLQLLTAARPPATTAGLQSLLGTSTSPATYTGTGPAAKECRFAWKCLQKECQAVVAAMLGMSVSSAGLARRTGSRPPQGGGWLAAVGSGESEFSADGGPSGDGSAHDAAGSSISFSLAEEAPEVMRSTIAAEEVGEEGAGGEKPASAAPTPLPMPQPSAAASPAAGPRPGSDAPTLISAILGGQVGRVELVASVYQPVTRLTEAAERLLVDVETGGRLGASGPLGTPEGASQITPTAPRLSALLYMPWRGANASPDPATAAGSLRSYLDTVLRMEFLPAVYVSTRERCQKLLESGDVLKPRLRLRGSYIPGAGVLPAATGVVEIAEEILRWASNVPPFAPHLAGVLENVLGRALEAFQAAISAAVGDSAAGKLASDVTTVQLLAKEPSAPLAGTPAAFFVGVNNVDAMESFVSSAITAGFGSSRKGLERDLVARISASARPLSPAALLAASGDPSKLIHLAALAESADHVADAIHAAAAATALPSDSSATPQRGGRGEQVWRRHLPTMLQGGGAGGERGFVESLAAAADHYRAAAGRCVRALRLELILQAMHHLGGMPQLASGGAAAAAAAERAAALARVVSQLDEALAPYLPPDRRLYVFGSLPPAMVQIALALLPEFTTAVGAGCVSQVCRLLSALQPVVCAAGGVGESEGPLASGMPDPSRQLEKAKLYYSLLTQSADGLIAAVAAKPRRFAPDEYAALLAVQVVGRKVTAEHKQQLANVLAAAT